MKNNFPKFVWGERFQIWIPLLRFSLISKTETQECYVPASLYFKEIISGFLTKVFLSHNADWRKLTYILYVILYILAFEVTKKEYTIQFNILKLNAFRNDIRVGPQLFPWKNEGFFPHSLICTFHCRRKIIVDAITRLRRIAHSWP